MSPAPEPCQLLAWDTEFFGRPIARITGNRLDHLLAERVERWCAAQQIECLYFLADSDDPLTVQAAEDHGYRLMDVRITLRHRLAAGAAASEITEEPIQVRNARDSDVPFLETIARMSYHNTRYYADPCFPDATCDELYATWIRRSCEGYANRVIVAEADSVPIGYISCHLSSDTMQGNIGLVGVSAEQQGRGVGLLLVNCALDWFGERGVQVVDVVTQGRNIAAQRLYQRSGFVTHAVQLWYHRWFVDCG